MSEQLQAEAPTVGDPPAAAGRRRPPFALLVPVGLLAVALVARPQQVRTTLSSPRVWLLAVAVVGLTLLLRRLTTRLPRVAGDLVVALPALIAMLVLVVPTVRGTTVDEGLEGLRPADSAAPAPAETGVEPVRLATGPIEGIGHRASGNASLVELPDGQQLVRFEDLDVDPGPDYRLYIVPSAGAEEPGDGVSLGKLKGTSGNQNYDLPAGTAGRPFTALIWCEAFGVAIAAATIS